MGLYVTTTKDSMDKIAYELKKLKMSQVYNLSSDHCVGTVGEAICQVIEGSKGFYRKAPKGAIVVASIYMPMMNSRNQ